MSLIIENLKAAINGESNAQRQYELFAEQSFKEKLPEVARLFRAVSQAEGVHVKNHLKALSTVSDSEVVEDFVKIDEEELKNNVKETKLNLIHAIKGEIYETKKMYKEFVKNSKKIGNDVAELSFTLARKAEKIHAELYSKYLKLLENNKKIEFREIYICSICGNIEFDNPPSVCPVCDHNQQFFKKL